MKIKTELEIRNAIDKATISWLEIGDEWTLVDVSFEDDPIEYELRILTEIYKEIAEDENLNEFVMDKMITNDEGDPRDVVQFEYKIDIEEILTEYWALKRCIESDLPFVVTNIYLPKMREDLKTIQKAMDGMAQTLIELNADGDVNYEAMIKFEQILEKL